MTMWMRVGFLTAAILSLTLIPRCKARATFVPESQMCWYWQGASDTRCPQTSPNPSSIVGGTAGAYAYAFDDQVGMNIHLSDGGYSNSTKLLAYLQYLNIHHVRDGISVIPGNSYMIATLNTLASNGIYADLITTKDMDEPTLVSDLGNINSTDYEAIEGPNELDLAGDSSWPADDVTEQQRIWSFIQDHAPTVKAIGPSIGGTATYSNIGDLSAYENYGNTHDYQAGFPPEQEGWGGPGYCGDNYGGVLYNQCNSKQASVSKPIAATEFGYQVTDTPPVATNNVDRGAQATYLIRQIFEHVKVGIPKSYIYALYDSGGQTFGLWSAASSPRIGASEFAGFMNILKDATPVVKSCTVPASTSASGVDAYGICFSDGRYGLVLWNPATDWDTNGHQYNTVATIINAPLVYSAGFGPSSVTQWAYPLDGQWSNSGSLSSNPNSPPTVPVTTRPSVVIFNGSTSPTPLPTMPP